MTLGLLGTKIGMTREFLTNGQSVPVTVIKVEKGRVLDVISKDNRGYTAVKVGFFSIKSSKLTNQMKGYFTKKNTEPKKILKEFLNKKIKKSTRDLEISKNIYVLKVIHSIYNKISKKIKLNKIENKQSLLGKKWKNLTNLS